jgi:hypothetical protein
VSGDPDVSLWSSEESEHVPSEDESGSASSNGDSDSEWERSSSSESSDSDHEVSGAHAKSLFAASATANRCPADILTQRHLQYGPASRIVMAAFKGGNGAWQTWLCGRLTSSSTHNDECDGLALSILHTIQNAPRLAGSREENTQGVRGTGATCMNRRLKAAGWPRYGPRCCLCVTQPDTCCFKWAAASQEQEVRAQAQEHPGLRANLARLTTAVPVSRSTVPTPALWVSAAQTDIRAMVNSALWKSARRYCTLQPVRAAAMARANVGKWTLQEWQAVTVLQLRSVSADENGLFRAAVRSLKAGATVAEMGTKLAAWCGIPDPGDPRLWSCWWCQAHLKYADAVEVFK